MHYKVADLAKKWAKGEQRIHSVYFARQLLIGNIYFSDLFLIIEC